MRPGSPARRAGRETGPAERRDRPEEPWIEAGRAAMDRGAAQRAGAGAVRVGDALGQRRQGRGAQCGGGRRARSVFLFALKRAAMPDGAATAAAADRPPHLGAC